MMAARSAASRRYASVPARSASGGVTLLIRPPAVMWQVVPCGQPPSRMTATPRPRPASVMPASRCAAAGPGAAASTTAMGCGPSSRSAVAGAADDHGFGLIERRVQCGRHPDAADGRVSPLPCGAGQEPGGVGGGDDDLGWRAGPAAGRPGQQAGQDGPGGGWCPRAGQAEAAEGGGVGGDLLAAADADRDRAGPGRDGARLAGRLPGCEAGGGGAAARLRGGRGRAARWLVQVQVRVGLGVSGPVPAGVPVAGPRAARSRAEMTGGGGAAGSRLEVSTGPGR